MGVGRRKLVPFWVLALALACGQHTGKIQSVQLSQASCVHPMIQAPVSTAAPLHGVTIIPPLRTIPVVRALNPAHTGRVCSTWGDFHYKTFDGQVFRFPGLCNYVFSAHCGAAYEDFNIQLRRGRESNATTLSRVTMKLDGLVVDLTKSSVLVNNHPVQLPFSQSGVLIELSSGYLKVVARLGLVFMWNDDDSLLLELDTKYINKTCGLCGDFNGSPESSEFLSHNVRLTPLEFGNLQKMDGPTEQCQDPLPVPQKNCSTRFGICEEILKGHLFSDCSALVDTSSYLEACRQDLCLCENPDLSSCVCHTLAEYSRQCAHAGGQPQDWRGPDLCSPTCPLNMQHQECGSPCVDTCSNFQRSQVCEDHCVAGCFCPEGTVLDDINQTGCVPVSQCACLYNGTAYAPGTNYSTDCTKCTCSGGQWSCQEVPCPGTCSVLGGAHFSTFDERQYTVHGDCSYVLSKPCDSNIFSVLAELRKCGLTDSETCLKSVTLSLGGGKTVVMVKATGEVFVNQIYTQLPVSTANVTLFRPSTFFIIAQTNLGLQLEIQLVPIMQVFVRLAPELRGLTCGLCGNFNSIQADDFQTMSGVVEGTAAAFFNTFKTQAACPNIRNNFEDPCSLSVENEKYAQHWCSQLTDASGPFSQCHTTVNPSTYFSNCMFDTCNCEKSEDCMCAALSSYVRACAAKGVLLSGWRDGVCTKPTTTCPKSMTYHYHISTCQPTCHSLNEEDVTCHVNFIPVDGCTCPAGTFLDDSGKCVQATSCPCYHRGSMVPNGESVHDSGAIWLGRGGWHHLTGPLPSLVCDAPMIYFDCRNATPGDTGAGCQKSCHTLDMTCYSSECVPGCVCPHGLVADGNGGCVVAEDCPCVHNEATYRPGETIRVGCNNCTCENRMWRCTDKPCLATCAVYGDGHYLTFDGQRYSFSGNCEYTLLQDHCGGNGSSQDAFRVVTENIPCGTTGTTCSKDIKIFLGNYELKLSDGKVEVVQKGVGQEPPYYVHQMGIYLVVETDVGLVLLWDRKTSIFLRLSPEFKGRVCGLCGNFDDNAINDFTTRSQSVVSDMLEFGNSWKFSPSCPDAVVSKDPCTANPYRKSWAQKQCSIINSETFTACHAHVEPAKYYEACVSDACACDSGGDCECFCTAVAAYAQACHEVGVCVSWRTPDICPLFCDYYNPEGQCEWHYQPCGAPCMRTCQNPNGHCLHDLPGLEGCYPKCPPTAPIFDEGMMQCVRNCTVTPSPPPPRPCRVNGKLYRPGATVPSDKNCYSCICTENGVSCAHDAGACVCTYNGQHFHPGEIIYHTTDGTGGCISAHCRANGTIERTIEDCSSTTSTPPTTFSFSTPVVMTSMPPSSTHPSPTLSVVYTGTPSRAVSTTSSMSSVKTPATASTASTMASTSTTPGCQECHWSPWMDVSHPGRGIDSGDFETLENLRAHGYQICQAPRAVECRAEDTPEVPLHVLGQQVECSTTVGLTCHNRDQVSRLCDNYQIRIQCCTPISCPTSSGPTQTTHLITSRTATMGTTTSLIPVTSTAHTESTVISGRSTHAPGPFPSSSPPFSSAPSPTTLGPVSSTAIKVNLSTTSPMPQPTSATSSVSIPSTGSTTASFQTTHECTQELCSWTDWIDGSYPRPDRNSGDFDTFKNLRSKGYKFCEKPRNVECRAQFFPNTPLEELGQDVICNREEGLICLNKNQLPPICYNYEIRIECCKVVDLCSTASATTLPTSREISTKTKTNWTTTLHSSSTKGTSTHSATIHTETWATNSPHTITQPGTTHCQPQCNWTKWFDTDFPVPGPHGGDLETYSNILRRGERICHRPEEITQLECRAENHPEMRVEDLGQVVQCDPTVGLVCRNRDQKDISGMCLNYEVRVLCCRIPEGCPGTSATPTVTSSHKPSFPVVSPSSVSPSSSTSPRVHSTTPCSCSVAGHLYPIGSIIYNKTDLDGHCYYAMCSQDCQVVRSVSQDCPSITPSPTPALFTSTSTTTPVIHREQCNVVPPRMKGDIWHMPNCSQATCEGNNVVSLSPRQCPEVKAPSCANGYPPVKVDDQDGCCQHFQCQCVCSGWGDPHYITFDGTYYTFLDNCTYVLVQQIVPVFGHFRVLIDNYFCDPGDSVSCPQSIIVEYHQDRVVLTRRPVDGIMTNQIIFNNKVVNPGFQQNGIIVSRVGIKMYVTIQEIGVQVMFSGLIFSVEVPFNMFANNTEGQCGTCTNDQKDECRLPGGALTSCSKMAPHWKVPNQPSCQGPPPTSTSVVPSPSQAPCPPSPICELLLSNLFQSCHDIIPPLAFYEGCLFDSCHGLTLEVVCSALELYASLCAAQGRCIPWRSQTNNTCPFTCPDNKVYQPCGPTNPQYCYRNDDVSTSLTLQEAGPFTEGCFCPDNMTPFSTNDSICVPSCQCMSPQHPGHTISIGCEDCTCREATLTCQRKPCPQTTCPEPGFVPVLEGLEAGQCCPQFSCACNFSHCPPPLHCPENSSLVVTYEEGVCCPSQTCSSRKGCEVNGTLYQPGAVISSSLCEACLCEAPSNFHADVFVVRCENKLCSNIQCPQGFEYQVKPGQCCGQCIQKGCLVKNSNSSTYFYLPGESWPEPEDPCVTHKCEQLQDVFTVVTMKKECPKIDCPPGHAQLREDGCCYDCLLPQQKCTVHQRQQIIRQQNCSSEGPVSLTYCQGNCGDSTSMYSLEANTVEHKCECCQELQTSQRSVTLRCDDGSSRTFSYTQVEKCGCLGQRCHALGDTSHPESSESEFKSKGSKEHGQ
uniref:Mucin-2 n=1 Tax=Peromyscus maniculatus bairdii TaxID=230844 RepID=A0A8C8TQU3_PERMB